MRQAYFEKLNLHLQQDISLRKLYLLIMQ